MFISPLKGEVEASFAGRRKGWISLARQPVNLRRNNPRAISIINIHN